MAPPPLAEEALRHRVRVVEDMLRQGYRPPHIRGDGMSAHNAACHALGINDSTLRRSLQLARETLGLEPDYSLYENPTPPPPPEKEESPPPIEVVIRPSYRVAAAAADGRGKSRHVVIGDAHDSPFLEDKSRFRWLGRLIADVKPDSVVQIGDFFSLDSLCKYDGNDTLKGKTKPSFKMDMESAKLALDAFDDGLGRYRCEKHVTLGNHEERALSFENRTPEIAGMVETNIFTLLGDAGWTYSPFGVYHFIGGVAFIHVPLNRLGRPVGGMYSQNQINRDALFDVVYGHTHVHGVFSFPKLNHQRLTVVNAGCALPDGHIEQYAKHSITGWTYGAFDLTIERGRIQKAHWTPVTELEERYG